MIDTALAAEWRVDVAERLLGDAVEAPPVGRRLELDRLELDGHLQPLAALERGDRAVRAARAADLDELVRAQLEQQRPHLRQRAAGQLAQPLERPCSSVSGVDLAQQAVGRERGGPQRLVDGIVQLACEALALLGGGQPGDLAGEAGVGDRRGGLVGDRPQPVGVDGVKKPWSTLSSTT